jgi:type IV pilus assembly protein PilY1
MDPKPPRQSTTITKLFGVIAGLLLVPQAAANLTELADAPLVNAGSAVIVKPNILFTLDDSGSMAWSFMPDSVEAWRTKVGMRNHLCNKIYYNPATTYVPPKRSDGTDFPEAVYTAARSNGFDTTSTAVNLSTGFQAYDTASSGNTSFTDVTPEVATQAYYFRFRGSGQPTASQCNQGLSDYATGDWEKVEIGTDTSARQNFVNWYSYYRTRMLLMKSAAGRAFVGLSDRYRVGFITINSGSPVASSKYLAVGDFNQTQKDAWFAKLYGQTASGGTPLRQALARAGRHFAGRQDEINSGMSGDPVQYSCQQNFSILTTDGYWNGANGVQMDGITAIGNQDANIADTPRPMYDGSSNRVTTTTTTFTRTYYHSDCRTGRRLRHDDTNRSSRTVTTENGVVTSDVITNLPDALRVNDSICGSSPPNPQSPYVLNVPRADSESTTTTSLGEGISDTLADVAEYYYRTDIRNPSLNNCQGTISGVEVCEDNVFTTGSRAEDDSRRTQHMTTFTLGLGVSGTLNWDPNYKTQTSGDYVSIKNGSLNWPKPDASATQNDPPKTDDLWHAAVNGRGRAFAADNPTSVVLGLSQALSGIAATTGSASAAATSNLEPTAGDNFVYTASYRTVQWEGDIKAREILLNTGTIAQTPVWSAQTELDALVGAQCDNRKIYLFRSGATNNLADFSWNTLACDENRAPSGTATTGLSSTEQAFFSVTQVQQLSQYAVMTDGLNGTVDQRTQAAGANLVNFVRGQNAREGFQVNDAGRLYRDRDHVLGDIINAQPVFVRVPFADYLDAGYVTFRTDNANRAPMVYAASNDGMLHAFNAGAARKDANGNIVRDGNGVPVMDGNPGKEAWAFVPSAILPDLFRLADNNYGNQHRYYVDGTPVAGDVFFSGAWKTIVVGGLNKGGRAYYALDITDPASPKGLWEFKHSASCYDAANLATHYSDCHLGYTYGNPIISKLADGTWVVFVTSGYNNVNSPTLTGDGQGYLYVLRAEDGKILHKIGTGVGSATDPSGLAKIANWVDVALQDNTTRRIYGGDLEGNLWRFDVNDAIEPDGREAFRLAELVDANGNPQPVMTRPELGEVDSPPRTLVIVGTGRYLGSTDLADTQTQTLYAIKDTFPSTTFSDLRDTLRQQSIVNTTRGGKNIRTVSCTGNCDTTAGWFADLPSSKERVTVDPRLQLGTLVVASNIPENTACAPAGSSWLNFFDYATGGYVGNETSVGIQYPDTMIVGINIVRLPGGMVKAIATTSDDKYHTDDTPFATPVATGRRVSWRELIVE